MSWARIDDQLHAHPKFEKAGLEATGLWVKALSWSSAYLTDGFIPYERLQSLVGSVHETVQVCSTNGPFSAPNLTQTRTNRRRITRIVNSLLSAGLWGRVEGGYQIRDFLDYNPSSTEIKAGRAAARERMRRRRSQDVQANNGQCSGERSEEVRRPRPVPSRPNTISIHAREVSLLDSLGQTWTQHTGLIAANGLAELARLVEATAGTKSPPVRPDEYADRCIAAFVAWVDGIPNPSRRPGKSPGNLVKHWERVQGIVSGRIAAVPEDVDPPRRAEPVSPTRNQRPLNEIIAAQLGEKPE